MSLALVTSAFGRLADVHGKVVQLRQNHEILARQTRRTADFQKRNPVIRFDWLEFAKAVRTLETKLTDVVESEARLREKVKSWSDKNFATGSGSLPRIDLEAIGVTNVAGLSTAGMGIPIDPLMRLGDGSLTDLATEFLALNQKAADALAGIKGIEKAHVETLMRAREVLRQKGLSEVVKDLDGVIAQNTADGTRIAGDPSVWILGVLGLWAAWKIWGWFRSRREVAHA